MSIRIEVLGSGRLVRDGAPVVLSDRRVGDVLTLLALHANTHLSTELIAQRVWDRDLDAWTRSKVERAVLELQQAIDAPTVDPHRAPPDRARIERSVDGTCQRLVVPADATDLMGVQRLTAQARAAAERGDHRAVVDHCERALRIWDDARAVAPRTGPRPPWPEFDALDELRAVVEQDLRLGQLAAGEDAACIVAELEEQVRAHPEDESWCALLMAALRACGHTARADAVYRHMVSRLGDGWGLRPGPRLRAEHQRLGPGHGDPREAGADVSIMVTSRHPEAPACDDRAVHQAVQAGGGVIVWRIRAVTMAVFTGPDRCRHALRAAVDIQERREREHPDIARAATVFVGSGWADRYTPAGSARHGATGPVLSGRVLSQGRRSYFRAHPGSVTVDLTTVQRTEDLASYEAEDGVYRLLALEVAVNPLPRRRDAPADPAPRRRHRSAAERLYASPPAR